jgi:tRNA A37 methylthiotransferase MiaB
MASYRITFVHAPARRHDQYDNALFSPLWAYTLASHVPASWDATVVDCLTEDKAAIGPASVFAFSGTNEDLDSLRAIHGWLKTKYPSAKFILGGPITWSLEQEGKLDLVTFFDHVFVLDGEETLPLLLREFEQGSPNSLPKVIRGDRFPLERARPIRFDLYRKNVDKYYGATIEVSRGCPFLCEFCDVRVLPDNNRANNKSAHLIIRELDEYFNAGITRFLFVCDNFIGDIRWAHECVDAMLAWQARTGARLSVFTWATVNIAKLSDLMVKMRRVGFEVLYIGIESVNEHALLETAKVQNRVALKPAVSKIQSLGFVIAPGFIFGFDSDVAELFENTLSFIVDAGLIGGDPSFLMAMPGTPLFQRMKRTRRLVERGSNSTSRQKIVTNIRYLLDARFLATGFVKFIQDLTDPRTQLRRFRNHVDLVAKSPEFVATSGRSKNGSGGAARFLKLQLGSPASRKTLWMRVAYLVRQPARAVAVLRGWCLAKNASRSGRDLDLHFYFWVYAWTSLALRYNGLREDDLVLNSVEAGFDVASLAQEGADVRLDSAKGATKENLQARYTRRALARLAAGGGAVSEAKSD